MISKMNSSTPVYFVLPIVNERYFGAYWHARSLFELGLLPHDYQISSEADFAPLWPQAREMELKTAQKTAIYRQVKRLELPLSVQQEIHKALKDKAQSSPKEVTLFKGLTLQEGKKKYRALLLQHHPDQGGDTAEFLALQKSYHLWLSAMFKKVR